MKGHGKQGIKTKWSVIVTLAFMVVLSGCNRHGFGSDGGSAPGAGDPYLTGGVPAPSPQNCFQNAAAQSWWRSWQVEAYPTHGQWHHTAFQQGFCGCVEGTMPTCAPNGLVCIPTQYLDMEVATWSWRGDRFDREYRCYNPSKRHHNRRHRQIMNVISEIDSELDMVTGEWTAFERHPERSGACVAEVAQVCTPGPRHAPVNGMICRPLYTTRPGHSAPPGIWVRIHN